MIPGLIGVIASSGGAAAFEYSTTGSPTLRTYGAYTSLHWTGTGNFVITNNPDSITFDVWIASGAGGGGGSGWGAAGGAGGGGGGAGRRGPETIPPPLNQFSFIFLLHFSYVARIRDLTNIA